jgi:membrane protease YdiL (CAAX protease family)
VNRFATPLVLVLVTALLFAYGHHPWSWVGGPLAAFGVWALDRKSREPAAPSPARAARRRDPAPVD